MRWRDYYPASVNILERIRNYFDKTPPVLPPGADKAERGRFGEACAAAHCRDRLGYRIVARNWRDGRDELDLICRDGDVLVFVEVRSRSAGALVSGYDSVNRHKKKVLLRATKSYLKQLQNPPKHFRFDIIDIALTEGEPGELRHFANIPLFNKHYHPAP